MEGKSRLQGELGRAAWSEAQPPVRVGVTARVKFDKREPCAALRMGIESVGCGKNLVARTFFGDAAWQPWPEAHHAACVRVRVRAGRKREPRAPVGGGLESSC